MKLGSVALVGAGPGDPGLITVKGLQCLRAAEVVVYDHLVNPFLLQFVSPKAKRIYVGKKSAEHTLEQEEINSLLVNEARRGNHVIRLKGGDPFLFGRGGEEVEALSRAGIPFEIVPGVTSAIAVPAYAGIPITHRDYASTVAFVTGHGKETPGDRERTSGFASVSGPEGGLGVSGEAAPPIEWQALSKIDTVVFLMGVGNLPEITKNLIAAGRDPTTPVAVIEWGTLPQQRKAVGTLQTIVSEVAGKGIKPPAVTVVGRVVSLADSLKWFEKKPLFGRRVLVTRSREQASELSSRLQEVGAEVFEIPTIEIRPPTSWATLDRAIGSVSKYHWLIFTSVNGVGNFFRRLREKGKDLRDLRGVKVAAIGPATARAVETLGIRVDSIAEEYRAEGLVRILAKEKLKGKRILIPRARQAREILVTELKRLGAKVDLAETYRTVSPKQGRETLQGLIDQGGIDLITFASSSTVENFMKMVRVGARLASPVFDQVCQIPVASIGPVTTKTAKGFGLNIILQPKKYTIPALVDSIQDYFSSRE